MDFIKYKVFLRSLVASIAPIASYSLGYLCYWLSRGATREVQFKFADLRVWLGILGLSVLYPLNKVNLWVLFRTIQSVLNRKIRKLVPSLEENAYLKGNYAPVDKEMQYEIELIVEGHVPKDISGVYLKNGPNTTKFLESGAHHWFDGDGMIHAFKIKDGKIFYCNRWV